MLKHKEMRIIDDAFDMHGGYVLDFSNRTFSEFFEDEFDINIYDEKYEFNGTSKANHLRAFIKTEGDCLVVRVLRALWGYKETLLEPDNRPGLHSNPQKDVKTPLFDLISRIEGRTAVPRTDVFENFGVDKTLEELIMALERDVQANKPAVALDRLHTYCMKKTAHLVKKHGGMCTRDEPLHSRMGKYIRLLEQQHLLREVSKRILKSAISIFEKFNDVRNNESLAHDNNLVDQIEARYIFDSITAILRFLKSIEVDKFEDDRL